MSTEPEPYSLTVHHGEGAPGTGFAPGSHFPTFLSDRAPVPEPATDPAVTGIARQFPPVPGQDHPDHPRCHVDGAPATAVWQRHATAQEAEDYWNGLEQNIRASNDGHPGAEYVADRTGPVLMAIHGCAEHDLSMPGPSYDPALPDDHPTNQAAHANRQDAEKRRMWIHGADCPGHPDDTGHGCRCAWNPDGTLHLS